MVRELSYHVGSELSYYELAQTIGADISTVAHYIDMLEKSFIIFRLYALSQNLRNGIKKSRKIYFYDNGIRNAVIENCALSIARTDADALCENYFVSERQKYLHSNKKFVNQFFWRTYAQQKIDYIEEQDVIIRAYEIKWNRSKKVRFAKSFLDAYPNHQTFVVNCDNYSDFLIPKSG